MKPLPFFGSTLIGVAMMQMPSTPPMKLGLWEETVTATTHIPGTAIPGGEVQTMKMRLCVTPVNPFTHVPKSCKLMNIVWTPQRYSLDLSCGTTSGHMQIDFDTPETGHGTMHMDFGTGGAVKGTSDSKVDVHFVSSSCGTVTPSNPEIFK